MPDAPKILTCRACGSESVTVEGKPPARAFLTCKTCGATYAICGAKGRSGLPCVKAPMANGRCANHGGKSTGGPIVHGRRSKFLNARLAERVEEGLRDPELVGLLEEIALLDAWITEEAEGLGEITQAQLWAAAISVLQQLRALEGSDAPILSPDAARILDRLKEILDNGEGEAQRVRKILGFMEQKRRMADTEIKRQVHLNQFVSARELTVLIAAIQALIIENVKDMSARAAIGRGLIAILGEETCRGALPGQPGAG